MLCYCEHDEETSSRMMSDYNIDLGERGVSSVPALMAKIVDFRHQDSLQSALVSMPLFSLELKHQVGLEKHGSQKRSQNY